MCRPPIDLIRAPELSHVSNTDIILACVNPIHIDELSDIEVVIDNEWFLKFLSEFFCFVGSGEYLLFWDIFATKLDDIGTELESSAKYRDIMGYEIDSAKFPGLSEIQETVFF
jgi:hypothetical protein